MNMYNDKTLSCKDCSDEFVFTAGEQEFYAEKGFQNEPTRCPVCRQARKAERNSGGASRGGAKRELFDATCSSCGVETKVPFQPSGDKPVYCRDCFEARREY